MLLQGVVDAAVRRIELGAAEEPGVIADAAVAMALRGVRGLTAGLPPPGAPAGARPPGRQRHPEHRQQP